jgi:hypothetical protein
MAAFLAAVAGVVFFSRRKGTDSEALPDGPDAA